MSRLQQKRAGKAHTENFRDGTIEALRKKTTAATKKHGSYLGKNYFLFGSKKHQGKGPRPVNSLDSMDYDQLNQGEL